MVNTIGRVQFNATIDGRRTPRDAERIGRQAGASASEGYDESWSKGYDKSLTESGRKALARWRANGKQHGSAYQKELGAAFNRFVTKAQKDIAGLRMDPKFLDGFSKQFKDAGTAAGDLQQKILTLREEGELTEAEFGALRRQVDDWAASQRKAAEEANASRDAFAALKNDIVDQRKAYNESTAAVERHRQGALAGLKNDLYDQARAHRELSAAIEDGSRRALERERIELEKSEAQAEFHRDAIRQLSVEYRTMTTEIDRSRVSIQKSNAAWSDIPHNGRQAILISAAVAAGMQSISVLSSAAGAGLLAVGGALSSLVIGGGGAIAVFSTLAKDIESLPPELQNTARQFRSLGDALVGVRDTISSAAIAEMPLTFQRLETAVGKLDPTFSRLGTSVGKVFDDFSKGLANGSEGFTELREMINNASDDFPALAKAAGTWAVSLMRGLNRANPMVDQLIGYVQELGDRFDDFTRSSAFDDWIRNSMSTFEVFGELLDATARALNDLVTPESIARTQQFMQSLTDFMPNLSKFLDIVGRLDAFGILAELLNQLGTAMEPLAEPAGLLADALRELAMDVLPIAAEALQALATVLAPVVTGLAGFVAALPPEFVVLLASFAAGIAALKGVAGLAGLATQFGLSAAAAGRFQGSVAAAGGTLKGVLGKAGMIGIAVVGVVALSDAILQMGRDLSGVEGIARNSVASNASLADSYKKIADSQGYLMGTQEITDWGAAIDSLNDGWGRFFGVAGTAGAQAEQLGRALRDLDKPMASLAQTNLPAAQAQMAGWAKEVGASDAQVLKMLNEMPEFKAALEGASLAAGDLATDQELVNFALGEGTTAAATNKDSLRALGEQSGLTKDQVNSLADSIRNFGSTTLDSREANRQYLDSLASLTESIATNGATLDLNTVAGRTNEAAIDDLAQSTLNRAAALLEETGNQEDANVAINEGRDSLIKQLEAFGLTTDEAAAYVDQLGLIPVDVRTQAVLDGVGTALGQIAEITRPRTVQITAVLNAANSALDIFRNMPKTAIGGTFDEAQARIIGEAGPEAVVPLNRPLSQVEPSVRWLSAIAQGKSAPPQSPSNDSVGRTVVIEAGAIVVQGAEDPRETAFEVADVIAERIGS